MSEWFEANSNVVGVDRVGPERNIARIVAKFVENAIYRNSRGDQFVEVDLTPNDVEVIRNTFPAMAVLAKIPTTEDFANLLSRLGLAIDHMVQWRRTAPVSIPLRSGRADKEMEQGVVDAREALIDAFDSIRVENDALRAQVQAFARGTPIGAVDRHGNQICIGDRLRFDEKEWGSPHEFTIELKDGELQYSGGGKGDLESWCEIIDPVTTK